MPGKMPERHTISYFITDGEAIKIGLSWQNCNSKYHICGHTNDIGENLAKGRMSQLQIGNPRRLFLLHWTSDFSESDLHRQFRDSRVGGEWFSPTLDLYNFLEKIKGSPPIPWPGLEEKQVASFRQEIDRVLAENKRLSEQYEKQEDELDREFAAGWDAAFATMQETYDMHKKLMVERPPYRSHNHNAFNGHRKPHVKRYNLLG